MFRPVVLLALSACTQAFVVSPRHRLLPFSLSTRGRNYSPGSVTARCIPSQRCRSRDRRGRKAPSSITMRVRRHGGSDVTIEGLNGEVRRVKSMRDSTSLQHLGNQAVASAAVAAAVVAQPEVDIEETEDREEGFSETWEAEGETEMESSEVPWEERDAVDQVLSGDFYDRHTKVYEPIPGVQIKKTYGFWTWQVFGFIFVQNFVRLLIRKGGDLKKLTMDEINWEYVVTEPEHLKELKAYRCEECGYTLFPARGRHDKFFDSVDDFKCPECNAPRSAFYDANDPDDPHNQITDEDEEEGTGDAGTGEVEASGSGVMSTTTASALAKKQVDMDGQDGNAASSEAPSGNGEEQEQETLSEPSYDDEFSTTKEADQDADDLLDF